MAFKSEMLLLALSMRCFIENVVGLLECSVLAITPSTALTAGFTVLADVEALVLVFFCVCWFFKCFVKLLNLQYGFFTHVILELQDEHCTTNFISFPKFERSKYLSLRKRD